MTTKVVHCKKSPYDVYIGRPSEWGNPFSITKQQNRDMVIYKYNHWLIEEKPDFIKEIPSLRGKILGCYCSPLACHGDTLAYLADTFDHINRLYLCPECHKLTNGDSSHQGCDMVMGRRGWRQLGIYDG